MKRDVQFVRAVDLAYSVVRDRVASDPIGVIGDEALEDGKARSHLVARLRGTEITRDVDLEVVAFDEPAGAAPGSHLLIRGDASRHPDLFPHLEARIDIVPVSEERTALFFVGTYKPPLGVVGGAADTLALHRFAEESLMRWFDELVAKLESNR